MALQVTMEVRKNFCLWRVVQDWRRLPREEVECLFLKVFRT